LYLAHFGSFVGLARDLGSRYLPGMTTTRSLLPERLIAAWMLRNLHRFANARFRRFSRRALRLESFFDPCEGRSTKPFVCARLIERIARLNEPRWQTTRVSPRALRRSADASERAFGTFPPAAGVTLLSGAGSGQ
jgi:hypothetical protein